MPILKPPTKPPKNETLQVRVEQQVKTKVHRYAEFIDASESYVVSEALKLLFRKDDEFRFWLEDQPPAHDRTRNEEGTRSQTFQKHEERTTSS